eukprot:gene5511-biopygen11756
MKSLFIHNLDSSGRSTTDCKVAVRQSSRTFLVGDRHGPHPPKPCVEAGRRQREALSAALPRVSDFRAVPSAGKQGGDVAVPESANRWHALWIMTEIALICADCQEVVGSAIAINILSDKAVLVADSEPGKEDKKMILEGEYDDLT